MNQPSSDRWPVRNWRRLAHVALLIVCLTAIKILTMVALSSGASSQESPFALTPKAFIAAAVAGIVSIAVLLLGLGKIGRVTPTALGWRSANLGVDVALGIGGGLVCGAITFSVGAAFGHWTLSEFLGEIAGFTVGQLALFAIIGLGAALTEETLYRGYLQPDLVARWGGVLGVLATACIFSLAHFQFRPVSLVNKLAVGLVFGTLTQTRRSLVPAAIAHFIMWVTLGAL